MINKHQNKLGKVAETILYGRLLRGSLIGLAVFVFGFVFLPYIIAEANATNDITTYIDWGAITLTLDPDVEDTTTEIGETGHGDVVFGELTPTENSGSNYGTLKVVRKKIGITSSKGKYYTVYLSMAEDADRNLNLQLANGSSDTGVNIPATNGSFATPAKFAGSGWGFAIPGVENTGVEDAPSTFVIPSLLNTQISSTTTTVGAAETYANTKWAAVPLYTAPQQIWKASTDNVNGFGTICTTTEGEETCVNGDTTNDHFYIYYGVVADTNTLAGTYKNEIVYTALASAASLDEVSKNIIAELDRGGAGDTESIRFDLKESVATLDEDQITVRLIPHDDLVAAGLAAGHTTGYMNDSFSISDLTDYLTDNDRSISEYKKCSVIANTLDFSEGYGKISCMIPTGLTVEDGSGAGTYDFWLSIDGYGYNYISKATYSSSPVGAFISAGLQSKYANASDNATNVDPRYAAIGPYVVSKMQEMTSAICSNTYRWNNLWGNGAVLYEADGTTVVDSYANHSVYSTVLYADYVAGLDEGATQMTSTEYDAAIAAEATARKNVLAQGSFALTDTRDGKKYVVRRFADGNCWMAQNLDLELYTGMTLTSDNTDLGYTTGSSSETKTTWTITDGNGSGIDATTNNTATNVGSLSEAWQATHKVGTVRLYKGTYDAANDTWSEEKVGYCGDADEGQTAGTQKEPCFVTTGYNTTTNVATYTVKQIIWDTTNGTTSGGYYSTSSGMGSACTMTITGTGTAGVLNVDGGYCRVETSGDTTITQYDGMSGYGTAIPEIASVTITDTATYGTDAAAAFASLPANVNAAGAGGSIATSAGDFRWMNNGSDGAHVYDQGLTKYVNLFSTVDQANTLYDLGYTTNSNAQTSGKITCLDNKTCTDDGTLVPYQAGNGNQSQTTTLASSAYYLCNGISYGSYTLGTTSGTLGSFRTCIDTTTGEPAADSGFAGNWYNWYAATAGSGTSAMSNADAPDSICPKGWQLPGNTGNRSFAYLLTQDTGYSLPTASGTVNINGTDTTVTNLDTALLSSPLSYARSGDVYSLSGGFNRQNGSGGYWDTAATREGYSFYFDFAESSAKSAILFDGMGFTVRCVAR